MSPNNENKIKLNIFHGTFSNLTSYLYLSKNIASIQRLSKSKFLSFLTKETLNNGNETKSDIFHWTYSSLASFFIGRKILTHFNAFYIWHFFQIHCKSEHKQVTWNRTKQYICKSNNIFPYLQSSNYLNEFWNLFLDMVYLKNDWQQLERKNVLSLISIYKC